MTTTEGCFCKEGHHVDTTSGGYYYTPTLWEKDGKPFCAHGWGSANIVWAIDDTNNVDLAQAVADYYLLDAIKADMLVPRPFEPKAHHSFEVRLHHDTKWRECCDTTEDAKHKQWCKPGNRKPSTTQAATYEPPFDEAYVRTVMKAMEMFKDIPATMPVIRTRAFLRHARHTAIMAQVFRNYAHYAIAGELTHYNSNALKGSFGTTHDKLRAGWFKLVQHFGGAAAAKYAERMFEDSSNWNTSYGGAPWAQIARTLWEFESGHWDAWLFVDRMFSLQHNTGSALNKVSWKQPVGHGYYVGNLQASDGPLDCHANSKFDRLGAFASEDVRKLATDYWVLANNEQTARGIEVTPMPEFTLDEAKPSSYYEPENNGCQCDLCQPDLYCKACNVKLNSKELHHGEYGGKCEGCAKQNNCEACGKKIVTTKVKCDACKKNGSKAKTTDPVWPKAYEPIDTTPTVTGYSLTPPVKKPLNVATPGMSPAAKLKAIQAAQAAEAATKAANVVDDGEWESDDDVW